MLPFFTKSVIFTPMQGNAVKITRKDLLGDSVVTEMLSRCTFPAPETTIVCGVSGGADSTALMILGVAAGCEVVAVHVDHGLREGSHLEAKVVEANAAIFGAQFRSHTVSVPPGGNLEARAREARYEALGEGVATGHTSDDQAETILLNLIRGTGLAGLRGIEPGFRHPILGLRRSDTEKLCEHFNLDIVYDPTNYETDFRRNKIRHLALPLLNEIAEKDIVPLLVRTSQQARETYDAINEKTDSVINDPSDITELSQVDDVVACVALHKWLKGFIPNGKMLDSATVQRALSVARKEVQGTQLPGGAFLRRSKGKLFVVNGES